jgi:hypothetical protein
MRILLLHPEDDPQHGPWAIQRWDRMVDLGMGGAGTYERWREFFGCPVEGLGFEHLEPEPIRAALLAGVDRIVDAHGVDWWEVISVAFAEAAYQALAVEKLAATMTVRDEVFVSRTSVHSRLLELLLKQPVSSLRRETVVAKLNRLRKRIQRLSPTQIWQVFADKYDPKHRIRAGFAPPPVQCTYPVILLPTAYVNVSRTALAYAEMLPEHRFLLVTARRNGRAGSLPANVVQADLASYVTHSDSEDEWRILERKWFATRDELMQDELLRLLLRAGVFDSFLSVLRQWLVVRDAWLKVFELEHISAVLSCDDSNPNTHIPVRIAKGRGIPAVACHHGALDGHYLFKSMNADSFLAKGFMEQDYLVNTCGVRQDQVEVAGPAISCSSGRGGQKTLLVFFSEDYEVSGARTEEFYGDLLPELFALAERNGKEFVIKLHPAENLKDRQRLLSRVISRPNRRKCRLIQGPLTEDLLDRSWAAVAVMSTTAVDCALRGIPVFLCAWLENWPLGYVQQFAAFGVGTKLSSPGEIALIPHLIKDFVPPDPRILREAVTPERLRELLFRNRADLAAQYVEAS